LRASTAIGTRGTRRSSTWSAFSRSRRRTAGSPRCARARLTGSRRRRPQLGTVGSGSHYVDLMRDGASFVWIGVHFSSRGLGHTSATRYLKAAGGKDGMNVALLVVSRRCGYAEDQRPVCSGAVGNRGQRPDGERKVMALHWLAYRRGGELAGVAIIEASSVIHARMRASLDGLDAGLSANNVLYAEGKAYASALQRQTTQTLSELAKERPDRYFGIMTMYPGKMYLVGGVCRSYRVAFLSAPSALQASRNIRMRLQGARALPPGNVPAARRADKRSCSAPGRIGASSRRGKPTGSQDRAVTYRPPARLPLRRRRLRCRLAARPVGVVREGLRRAGAAGDLAGALTSYRDSLAIRDRLASRLATRPCGHAQILLR
jgi:hypothetical protein